MANLTCTRSKHATTTGGAQDTVTMSVDYPEIEVVNRDDTASLIAVTDSSVTLSSMTQDDTDLIPPMTSVVIESRTSGAGTVVKVFSDAACDYSVYGVNE